MKPLKEKLCHHINKLDDAQAEELRKVLLKIKPPPPGGTDPDNDGDNDISDPDDSHGGEPQ